MVEKIENNKKKVRKILVVFSILLILILCAIIFILLRTDDEDKKTSDNVITKTKDEEKWITPSGEVAKINVYTYDEVVVALNENDDDLKEDVNYKKEKSYSCNTSACTSYGAYYNKNYVIIKDDYYYIYNYKENKVLKLNLPNAVYNNIMFLGYKSKVYGLTISNINDLYAYYSLEEKEFITTFKYNYMMDYSNPILAKNRVISGTYDGVSEKYFVIDLETGKELWESDTFLNAFGNEDYVYYIKEYGYSEFSEAEIYNEEFKSVLEGKRFSYYGTNKNGTLALLNDDNTFSLYNKEGILIKTSKKYKSVGNIFNGYVAVIDNDDYLKLVNYDGNVVAKFIKIKDSYTYHPELSYYKDDNDTIIYLTVFDSNVDAKEDGNLLLYYYDEETKDSGVIKSSYDY